MDLVWDSMNVASRIVKQIEQTDSLVPKSQQSTVTPVSDLQEVSTTVNSVRTTLVPFVTSAKKSKVSTEQAFEICIKGIKDTLNDLFAYFRDLEKDFTIYTWKTQKVKIYQMDFLLRQKLDQFAALFNVEEAATAAVAGAPAGAKEPKKKDKQPFIVANCILDPDGRELWIKSFGEQTLLVPWPVFFQTVESRLAVSMKEEEEFIKMFIGFTRTDHISPYEFAVFLKWFGPFKGSFARLLEALKGGLLCGFVPAVEANLLLEGKRDGTYLVRCSKTQPGSFAVTFVDSMQKVKHCLLYWVAPHGLTLKNPPTVYQSLKEFADSHTNKLKHPLGNRWTLKKKLPGFDFRGDVSTGEREGGELEEPAVQQKPEAEGNTCIVCMDAPFETVFLECGHLACCARCSDKLKLCPICRNPIVRVVNIFRA
eukprot:TRINITY_DN1952_c0_g2_i1.p1 TRINITY_DN1952_c0_g2~~TRINITY_DN1952_c0_g2_i1.p1  ORF type:complete len:424 (-),score=125.44 TRINITY_DN1952_c0_g2_i1:206-1477(-)